MYTNVVKGKQTMSDNVRRLTAKEKTLQLWDDVGQQDDEGEIQLSRQVQDFDPHRILLKWAAEAQSENTETKFEVHVCRFKNKCRGIQFVRFESTIKNPSFNSTLVLKSHEYYTLAQCIFRESKLIQELLEVDEECDVRKTDAVIDKIRKFTRG